MIMISVPIVVIVLCSTFFTSKMLKDKVNYLNANITQQMELNGANLINDLVDTTYATAVDGTVAKFSPTKNFSQVLSNTDYESISYIKKSLNTTYLSKGYSDLFVVYAVGEILGNASDEITADIDATALYKVFNEYASKGEIWVTGLNEDYSKLYIARKINNSGILVFTLQIAVRLVLKLIIS